ncbi:SDR family NAD(P)-dependent oxidoreductase [Nocardia vermiculata]|uniref:SDR family oxidoreductase n=1 Tax=Nocardia vermiculata TaxID=257274 RepID=A0A846XY47_9NOCA|nr:SDR family oxidoreductase [Nocardia vermiculata]NKY52023.1 SDR family oxidoreductase [Nocardia vermiculata]
MDRSSFQKLFDLSGRTAIVTGGTRGIGLALAEGLACAGANVVVASRKPEACDKAAERMRELGAEALGVPTHLGEVDALQALVATTVETFGGVDIVINNAANALTQPLESMQPAAVDKSFAVNVQGPVFLVQAALPYLKQSEHAAVLNFGSIGAFGFSGGLAMYSAGKAALLSFTRSMAAEFAADGIRVNAVTPGAFDTDMVRNNPTEVVEAMAAAPLLRRLGTPDELVGTMLLLCSDAGSFITGQTFVVDGGTMPR